MNVALWIGQIVLAAVFGAAGTAKLTWPHEKMAAKLGSWVNAGPRWAPRALGAAELAAAIGLIVPPLLAIAPILTPLAAIGAALVMAGAVVLHARHGEPEAVSARIGLGLVALAVAWGRLTDYSL